MKLATTAAWIAWLALIPDVYCMETKEVQRIEKNIDWEAADKAKQKDAELDGGGIKQFRSAKVPVEVLDKTSLPILVFGTGQVRAAPKVYTQKDAYASTYRIGGDAKITILGSRSAIKIDDKSTINFELSANRHLLYTIDFFEDGVDLNFSKFGADYTLRITCAKLSDQRCTKRNFVVSAYESLIVVGGKK